MFLDRQDADGHIGRSVPDRWHHDMVKPFLAQLALLAWHADEHLEWLRGEPYRRLVRYVENWLEKKDQRGAVASLWQRSALKRRHLRGHDDHCPNTNRDV